MMTCTLPPATSTCTEAATNGLACMNAQLAVKTQSSGRKPLVLDRIRPGTLGTERILPSASEPVPAQVLTPARAAR